MVRSCRLARRREQARNRRAARASDGNIQAITTPEQEQSLSTRRERERLRRQKETHEERSARYN